METCSTIQCLAPGGAKMKGGQHIVPKGSTYTPNVGLSWITVRIVARDGNEGARFAIVGRPTSMLCFPISSTITCCLASSCSIPIPHESGNRNIRCSWLRRMRHFIQAIMHDHNQLKYLTSVPLTCASVSSIPLLFLSLSCSTLTAIASRFCCTIPNSLKCEY